MNVQVWKMLDLCSYIFDLIHIKQHFIVINSSCAQKNMEKFVVLPFGHMNLPVNFKI